LQILRNLVTHGILRSTRGVDGGYALIKSPDQISLLEVIEAIEGPYDAALEVGDGLPEDSQNKLRTALSEVTISTRNQLEAIKLAQLLKPPPVGRAANRVVACGAWLLFLIRSPASLLRASPWPWPPRRKPAS
jgi:DNA-binding IscR family transcriptional regulator